MSLAVAYVESIDVACVKKRVQSDATHALDRDPGAVSERDSDATAGRWLKRIGIVRVGRLAWLWFLHRASPFDTHIRAESSVALGEVKSPVFELPLRVAHLRAAPAPFGVQVFALDQLAIRMAILRKIIVSLDG